MRRTLWLIPLILAPLAAAHGDADSLEGTWALEPGERVTVERAVHWHRAMGTLRADGDVAFLAGGEVVAGPGRDVTIDHLVACCDAVWTDYAFAVENVGDAPVTVRADVAFLHDNLAVTAHDAEPGAWWQTLFIIGLLVGVPAWRARQGPVDDERDWLRASRVLHAATWGIAVVLAVVGMVRFGSGPLVGSLGTTAWMPGGLGPLFNTHSLVMLLLMALWGAAYACWCGARRRTGAALPADGYAFAAGSLLVGALMLIEFGGWIPVVVGVVPAAGIVFDVRRPPHRPREGEIDRLDNPAPPSGAR